MSRKTDGQSKYFRKFTPTTVGELPIIEEEKIFSINAIRLSINGECTVQVHVKTLNDSNYILLTTVGTLTSYSKVIDVSTWDYIKYTVTAVAGAPTVTVSGFFNTMHPMGELQIGRDYDKIVLNEVSSTIHEYTYTLNEIEVITLRVTYTNSSDKIVQSLEVI